MSALRVVLPAMALAAGAFAQCKTSGTLTITAAADASSLASCKTYSGSIAIATDVAMVALDGPTRITGDLIVKPNGQLTSLEAADLEIVDGELSVTDLQNINSLSMPSLTQVDQLTLTALGPYLLGLDFGSTGLEQVTNLSIINTYLQNLDGINLFTAGTVEVTSNILLKDLSMQLRNTTGGITIRGNSNGLNVNLGNLESTGALIINDCSAVDLASLKNSSGLVALSDNYFDALAMPNLTMAGGVTVNNNTALTNLSLPVLEMVASLDIYSNNGLGGTFTLPSLERITGAAYINGSFTSITMPKLDRVDGRFYIHSTKVIGNSCAAFDKLGSSVFQIAPVCSPRTAAQASATNNDAGPSATGDATTTTNAALRYGPSEAAYGIFAGLAALMGLLM